MTVDELMTLLETVPGNAKVTLAPLELIGSAVKHSYDASTLVVGEQREGGDEMTTVADIRGTTIRVNFNEVIIS